ncbi:organ-specific protein s2 [Phtheirospermum japonicum]|uniref:Organ-specific protein s2 n=1 Tax=Phtheirospermum japonicum TaxID=374723 RepID=A0A830C8C0_9LAMI|nr:organ-specific protein s2 [Phtheirospermum japonicum]
MSTVTLSQGLVSRLMSIISSQMTRILLRKTLSQGLASRPMSIISSQMTRILL